MPGGLDKNLKILPHYIKEAGYSAHMVGKWHLGQAHEYDMPWNKGFDTFLGFLEAQTDNFSHKMSAKWPHKIHTLRDHNGPVWKPGTYITNIFTNQTIDILNNSTKPSFTYLAYNAPHLPHSAPKWALEHLKTLRNHARGSNAAKQYFGSIKALDSGLKLLWESAKNLERETIFIFSSDNGGAAPGCNRPYRGWKSKPEEGGIRIGQSKTL